MSQAPKPRLIRSLAGIFSILGCFGLLVCFTPLGFFILIPGGQYWCEWRNRGEYERHRAEYDALVPAIQARSIPAGGRAVFRVDADKSVASLRPIASFDRADETDTIVAEREPDGRLTLRITTYSMGHAGVYGLYYSGGVPAKDEVAYSFGADGRIAPVGTNWWSVSDYSQ